MPTGQNCKRCPACKREHALEVSKERWHRTYAKKGYNQAGANNNAWAGGSSPPVYQKLAFDHYGKVCQRCGVEAVLVHHKDEDRHNSDIDNLEPLCKRCHQLHHGCVQNLPQFLEKKA